METSETSSDSSSRNQSENIFNNFQKKPLYYWVKSFAEKEIQGSDSFKSFIGSNAVIYALEYIGITTEAEQSSLHLSAIFDEDVFNSSNNSNSISNNSSHNNSSHNNSHSKYSNHFDSETKSKIQLYNKIFNQLKSYFEETYNQLVLIRPPNSVHISSACSHCSILEFEKILILLLGGAIQGVQRQDTIRKIKSYPSNIQEALIEAIKLAADNPELLHIKSWNEVAKLHVEEQQKMYESLLALSRRLLVERNELVQTQLLSDYIHGYTNCETKRSANEWKCCELYESERNSDELRTTNTMRQLRDELLEKSELLQECREELESTKLQLKSLQDELTEAQKQLRSFKKARDELDVLREGQEKTVRLESELQRMKKKLEDSEQYYEKIEILQNENRNFQLKHAILMDQINMLTVDKERLEISFYTQNHYGTTKGQQRKLESDEEYDNEYEKELNSSSLLSSRNKLHGPELLIDTTNINIDKHTSHVVLPVDHQDKNISSTPNTSNKESDLLPDITPITLELESQQLAILKIDEPPGDLLINVNDPQIEEEEAIINNEVSSVSNDDNENVSTAVIITEPKFPKGASPPITTCKDKSTSKRSPRKSTSLNTKRTRRALLFSPSSSTSSSRVMQQKKVQLNDSIERLNELEEKSETTNHDKSQTLSQDIESSLNRRVVGSKFANRSRRRRQQQQQQQQRITSKDKRNVSNALEPEDDNNDADEELSLSPNIIDNGNDPNQIKNDKENIESETELQLQLNDNIYPNTTTILEDLNNVDNNGIDDDNDDLLINNNNDDVGSESNDSENDELFFICSSNATTSASSSNLKISNGRNVPIVQITTGSSTMRPSDSDDIDNDDHTSPPNHEQQQQQSNSRPHNHELYTQDLLTNCNIQLSLRHVNSHDVNIGHGHPGPGGGRLFEYPIPNNNVVNVIGGGGGVSTSTAYVNKLPKYSTPRHRNLHVNDDSSSSEEDDDSVWYEYGCV